MLMRCEKLFSVCWNLEVTIFFYAQEHVLSGGHGLMVQGYYPVIKALAKDLDIRLNHRCVFVFLRGFILTKNKKGAEIAIANISKLTCPYKYGVELLFAESIYC